MSRFLCVRGGGRFTECLCRGARACGGSCTGLARDDSNRGLRRHPLLPEYDRTVTIEVTGGNRCGRRCFQTPAGFSRTNLYRLDAQHVLLRDVDASHTTDLAIGVVSKDDRRRTAGMFIGSFAIDDWKEWRFIPASEREELETEFHGGSESALRSPDGSHAPTRPGDRLGGRSMAGRGRQ
jgi:hypothetical protein